MKGIYLLFRDLRCRGCTRSTHTYPRKKTTPSKPHALNINPNIDWHHGESSHGQLKRKKCSSRLCWFVSASALGEAINSRQSYYQLGQFHDPRGYLLRRFANMCAQPVGWIVMNYNCKWNTAGHSFDCLCLTNDEVCLDEPGYDAAFNIFLELRSI